MKGREGLVCAACGTLNRPNWEFCARCNEPLENAAPTLPPAPTVVVQQGLDAEDTTDASPLVLMAGVTAMVLLFGVAYRYVSASSPPAGPDPGMFTIATVPPEPPEPPLPEGRGAIRFDEGRRLLASGDAVGAVAAFDAAVAADPENARYRSMLAAALWKNGDPDRALAENAEAARLDPRLQTQYARALDVAGRTDEAIEAYEAVVAGSPHAALVREDLGRLLFRTGAYADAADHLEAAVRNRPDDPVLAQELAYSLDQAGQKERATDAYRRVLERAPQASIARGLLSENLYDQGNKTEAMTVIQEGLALTPDAPLLRRQMGSLLERSGNRGEAAQAYREYARLAPNAPDARAMVERAARLDALAKKRP